MPRIGAGRITAPPRGGLVAALAATLAAAVAACGSTVDSVGYNGPSGIKLKPLTPPLSYPNAFRDLLGKTDEEIGEKVNGAFDQLFHGDPSSEAIYFPMGANQALIRDIFHDDIRTEGIGWGMIIAVQLDKREEFDRLWTFSKAMLQFTDPPSKGYFVSSCDTETGAAPCTDPFGMEQFVTALLFAMDRWTGGTGAGADAGPGQIDYGADAAALLDVMRHKQDANGGVVDHVTDVFDPITGLAFDVPDDTSAGRTRPSIIMPAFYELWAQATGDSFWLRAAESGRALWKSSAHETTGLTPVRSTFEGVPIMTANTFQPEAYRTQVNIVLDDIWFGRDPWLKDVSTRLLTFFTNKGIKSYGAAFSLPGTTLETDREPALIAVNGITALSATNSDRTAYVKEVWDMAIPSQNVRYYQGILYLKALLILSGNYRVW